jgi:putative sterol carrier protein
MMKRNILITSLLATLPLSVSADFMDAEWATKACEGWNANEELTTKLGGKWVDNNADRGYKLVQMYRSECGEDTKIQLTLESKDGKAICGYGGVPDGKALDPKVDYVMHAKDKHWTCIGAGKFGCGAMGAMSTGKLKFAGPKMEAMGVMGPFGAFLRLTGEIEGEKVECTNSSESKKEGKSTNSGALENDY